MSTTSAVILRSYPGPSATQVSPPLRRFRSVAAGFTTSATGPGLPPSTPLDSSPTPRFPLSRPRPRYRRQSLATTVGPSHYPAPQYEPALWFRNSPPSFFPSTPPGSDPEQEQKVKLGKTLRILQSRLPTLLQKPLPQDILAKNISLHLFPSTHPDLPIVSGRVAYIAALWTSPIAWKRIPLIGNVKIHIVSERITTEPHTSSPCREGAIPQQLVVKWKTEKQGSDNWGLRLMKAAQSRLQPKDENDRMKKDEEFTGLFVFEFDKEGKILSHTIETLVEGGVREGGVSPVLDMTEWVLRGMRGAGGPMGVCQRTDDV